MVQADDSSLDPHELRAVQLVAGALLIARRGGASIRRRSAMS